MAVQEMMFRLARDVTYKNKSIFYVNRNQSIPLDAELNSTPIGIH